MNKLTKNSIVAAGLALAIQSAHAANNNDVFFSVNNNDGGGSTEFTVNLGSILTFTGPNDNLSSFVSSFNTQYASATASGLNVGAAGGQNGQGGLSNPGAGNDVFLTTLRLGGGSYTTAGTEGAPSILPNSSTIAEAGGLGVGYNNFGANLSTSDPNGSFTQQFATDPNTAGKASPNWVSDLGGDNPLSTMTGSTITLDLWSDTQTSGTGATTGWVYEGDLTFTVDPTGDTPATLVWDTAPVPEPSTASLFGGIGFGLLGLSLRRKLRSQNA